MSRSRFDCLKASKPHLVILCLLHWEVGITFNLQQASRSLKETAYCAPCHVPLMDADSLVLLGDARKDGFVSMEARGPVQLAVCIPPMNKVAWEEGRPK